MFRLFECCALSFFERFVLSFSLKIERFVSDSAEIWICGLYAKEVVSAQRTLCKVTKGGKEIQEAFQKGQKLIVISRKGTVIDSFTKSLF